MSAPGIVVLLSGSGRTLLNIADRIESGELKARIAMVIASRECLGAERARERGFDTRIMPGDIEPSELKRLMTESDAAWIVLAGYLRLLKIPPALEGRVVNIHPALLPSFGGVDMFGGRVHRAVIDAGCKVSGCTVHLCDAGYDTGPIVLQRCCPVEEDDTPDSLAARVFELEIEAYPEALRLLLEGHVSIEGRRVRIMKV
ncbi:MAG: phosphoribosylglycinamide formyltransferase [Phycisphaeraceae bacterium]|nr:MAG: phosphoribosylglycinamide formyltransferase [Phycisphaeraceae bacterium]